MSAGTTKVAALDIVESAADVPTEVGLTRFRRNGGLLQRSEAGGIWTYLDSVEPYPGSVLGDANATIEPWTDKAGIYVLPANTLTANRVLQVNNTGGSGPFVVVIVVRDTSAFTYTINNSVPSLLFTKPANPGRAMAFALYSGAGGAFATNYFQYIA